MTYLNKKLIIYLSVIYSKIGHPAPDRSPSINQFLIYPQTINIDFKERRVLKTVTYSILSHILCKQELKFTKIYIYKVLDNINPKTKGFEYENYILRQIYLHFLLNIIQDSTCKSAALFLDKVFSYEFLSSLLCDHLLFSVQKLLKISEQKDDLYSQIEQISIVNNFTLHLLSRNKKEYLQYQYSLQQSREIFIYFEQNFNQDKIQAVYYVSNPSDSFITKVKSLQEM
ncbi:hypothetical protein ABPG74_020884 [Tetrahymena malaccensis]